MRIIGAAVGLLNDKGVGVMTLQEVAQGLGLTTTSVTYYYRYKEQLAAAVFEDTINRLGDMVAKAAEAPTPHARVARYVELYFDALALAMLGRERPMAFLSEIRTLEDEAKQALIAQYQGVFRSVRLLFGDVASPEEKRVGTARAQLLNEALFWASKWLQRYPLGDLANIRRRTINILERGIATPGRGMMFDIVNPDAPVASSPQHDFLQVASRLINDIGYKGASIDRIVTELKITKKSFYYHLDAKDDLILACYREDYQRLGRLPGLIDAKGRSVGDRLSIGIASAVSLQFDGTHPLLRITALQAMPETVRKVAIERFERSAIWLSGLLVDGMEDGSIRTVDPMIAANVIISAINSAYDLRSWARRQERDLAISTYVSSLLGGLFGEAAAAS